MSADSGLAAERLSFPLPEYMPTQLAADLLETLAQRWSMQVASAPRMIKRALSDGTASSDDAVLRRDLDAMSLWFQPTATEKSLRAVLADLPPAEPPLFDAGDLLLPVRPDAGLVTPEGRAALWCLVHAQQSGAFADADLYLWIDPATAAAAEKALLDQYRNWCLRRLKGVAGLLQDETATLRPTAAGMLLVLLINRNTAPERAVPRPSDESRRRAISAAIAEPALAYAHALTGREKAAESGMDLYRGWALGELSRRLGGGIETARGIYIRPEAEDRAVERLVADLRKRPPVVRQRVAAALDAALASYEKSRPVLSSLGLAHERPSNTAALRTRLLMAATNGEDGR